ncbi:MAG: hypothetical protein CBD47_07155 [Synechococcus sp. TMED187]|uniref:hypothetical protein n=1 Tax=unclassified Synechococcus TaxID=2626047 RepID=UPI000B74349E|nr:hypothetical protein [Synechococcus sp. UW105]OUW46201.1 MAG: hypothetical protein CBD47_07155 [Synechococcus sp. TMED187]RZO13720.1 MAG: hypothetical protein EVB08_04615 [Synechococcus sp. MED-G135]
MKRLRLYLPLPLALGGLVFAMPLAGLPMGELQALNHELGRLCSRPPREALAVCRIHARLVRSL